jgi:hypothetical protein
MPRPLAAAFVCVGAARGVFAGGTVFTAGSLAVLEGCQWWE